MDRKFLLFGCELHGFKRLSYPRSDHRILYQSIGAYDVYRLRPLLWRQLPKSEPHQLERGSRIFSAAISYDPWDAICEVYLFYLFKQERDGFIEAVLVECRFCPLRISADHDLLVGMHL